MAHVFAFRRALLPVSALVLAGALACHRDQSPVLARIGTTQRLTENDFKEWVNEFAPTPEDAKTVLTDPARKEQRDQLVEQLAFQKAIVAYGKRTGLDKEPKVQHQVEQAVAQAYFQALVDKRATKAEPTDADLKAFYDEVVAQRKTEGQDKDLPTFDQVKAQLVGPWKQRQKQKLAGEVEKEIRAKMPVTLQNGAAKK